MKKLLLLTLILTLGLVLVLGGCNSQKAKAPAPAPVATPTPEPVVTEPAAPESVAPAPTEEVAVSTKAEGPAIDYGSRGILSDVKCEKGIITGIITNAFLETDQVVTQSVSGMQQKSDIRLQVNGMNIFDYVCDKASIASKEYTYCSNMMGRLAIKVRTDRPNEIAVWFSSDPNNRGTTTVSCTEVPSLTYDEALKEETATRTDTTTAPVTTATTE